ncbi:MAG TPA: heavy metal-binding protein [Prolixibacteraceae bacterium]|nr:heavy metal-binding protein [Prolixibacteraceae bacterium]
MKKLTFIIGLILLTFGNLSAQKTENKVVCFKSDMDCANCEKTITEHLKFEKGVKDLKIDHSSNTIYIEYKAGKNTDEGFAKAIEKKGYKAEKISKADYDKVLKETAEKGHGHEAEVHKVRNN